MIEIKVQKNQLTTINIEGSELEVIAELKTAAEEALSSIYDMFKVVKKQGDCPYSIEEEMMPLYLDSLFDYCVKKGMLVEKSTE